MAPFAHRYIVITAYRYYRYYHHIALLNVISHITSKADRAIPATL
jgi:hypothetical protein